MKWRSQEKDTVGSALLRLTMADNEFGVAYLTWETVFNDIRLDRGFNGFVFDCDVLCAFNGADATTIPCTLFVHNSVFPGLAEDHVYELCAVVCVHCVVFNVFFTS